jgi:hypothetical protein
MQTHPLVSVRPCASSAQRASLLARSLARADSRFARAFVLASQGSRAALDECKRVALALRPAVAQVDARKVARENETKRARDLSRVVVANPFPRAFENVDGFDVTLRKSKAGLRPVRDAADARDKGTAASYRAAVAQLARSVSEKHVRQARMRCEHLRAELAREVESAAGEFFARRLARAPRLASDLLARFALGILPASTLRNLHRCARRACDARMARMGGKSKLVEPSFFNLFSDESAERSAELDAVFVNARVDALLAIVREKSARSGNAARAGKAHAQLLESARAYFLASIKGEAVALPSAGLVASVSEVGLNVCETRSASAARETAGPAQRFAPRATAASGPLVVDARDGRASVSEVVRETRGTSLANSALYFRLARLAKFTGAQDVARALGSASTR